MDSRAYKILLFGRTGQLGWELRRTLPPLGQVTALDFPEIDFTHTADLERVIREARPDVILNAVAYTAVDRAETEPAVARAINATAVGVLAALAAEIGAAFIHYSTDYVFDGKKGSPYVETDPTSPLGVYGQTKLEGEQLAEHAGGAALVFRTSWVYSTRRDSFVTKVLKWSRSQPQLRMVTDQVGCPTWSRMLAEMTAQVLARAGQDPADYLRERRGIYHLAGSGYASRLAWAESILQYDPHPEEQMARMIHPALTADFPTPAERPLFSALDCRKFEDTFGVRIPPWQESLRLAMEPE